MRNSVLEFCLRALTQSESDLEVLVSNLQGIDGVVGIQQMPAANPKDIKLLVRFEFRGVKEAQKIHRKVSRTLIKFEASFRVESATTNLTELYLEDSRTSEKGNFSITLESGAAVLGVSSYAMGHGERTPPTSGSSA